MNPIANYTFILLMQSAILKARQIMRPCDHAHPHSVSTTWVKFCPRCAAAMEDRFIESEHRVRKVCPGCGFIFYLNPKVVAAAIPQQGGRIWLLRRNIEPGVGLWTFPGSYVDLGEPVTDAAVRETREEMLLDIRLDGLLNVYSYSTVGVVLVVYLATVIGGQAEITSETQEVRDFEIADLPWDGLAFPSTRDALIDYCRIIDNQRKRSPEKGERH